MICSEIRWSQAILFASYITIYHRVCSKPWLNSIAYVSLLHIQYYNGRMQRSEDQRRIMLFGLETCYDPIKFSLMETVYRCIELANISQSIENIWFLDRVHGAVEFIEFPKKETIHKPFERICNNS